MSTCCFFQQRDLKIFRNISYSGYFIVDRTKSLNTADVWIYGQLFWRHHSTSLLNVNKPARDIDSEYAGINAWFILHVELLNCPGRSILNSWQRVHLLQYLNKPPFNLTNVDSRIQTFPNVINYLRFQNLKDIH